MFKWFVVLLAFIIINVLLVVLTAITPFLMIYGIFTLFVKKPESKKSFTSGLLTTIIKDYATNKSKLNTNNKTVRGAETKSL